MALRCAGGSLTQFGKTIKKFNWNCVFVDVGDFAQVRSLSRTHRWVYIYI